MGNRVKTDLDYTVALKEDKKRQDCQIEFMKSEHQKETDQLNEKIKQQKVQIEMIEEKEKKTNEIAKSLMSHLSGGSSNSAILPSVNEN